MARPLLKGETTVQLRGMPKKLARPSKRRRDDPAAAALPGATDSPLFERLRAWRRRVAEAQGVPPFVIFHDSTLHEVARLRPQDEAELAQVSGVGAHKLERYGTELLRLLADP